MGQGNKTDNDGSHERGYYPENWFEADVTPQLTNQGPQFLSPVETITHLWTRLTRLIMSRYCSAAINQPPTIRPERNHDALVNVRA